MGLALAVSAFGVVGCSNATEYTYLGAGATAFLAQAPASEIEQVYYLGVFDPQDQLPPQVYRLTVHGQASAMSGMKFGSGWVHSSLIDSLTAQVGFEKDSLRASISAGDKNEGKLDGFQTGRRLVMFGPEGFREAPRDFRLAIVMGASPENFFKAIDTSLGLISRVQRDQIDPQVTRDLLLARAEVRAQQARLDDLQ